MSCFKTFKAAFQEYWDSWTLTHRGMGAKKEGLASWMARGLNRALAPKNIKWFKLWNMAIGQQNNTFGGMETREKIVHYEEVESIMHVRNGVTPCHYFVDKDRESNLHIVNPIIIKEESGCFKTWFWTLPRLSELLKERRPTPHPQLITQGHG